MGYPAWILLFAADCLFCLWVLRWGGAEWMEGWRSLFFIDWLMSIEWTAEQIKFYVLFCWIGHAIWFLVGLFFPGLRFHG
ncbi:hypothetical protein [Hydrogenophaga sp. 5NK40-0174]|uniref:hypothetical protein n=1 Tax=Hydrogenophaga sp. 5NK40-0174 TaxID=3127649 RepID=UPI003108FF8D